MRDLNAGFLLDIWEDLKAKKLAPVAVALGVALIAIPALMMKGDESGGNVALPVPVPGGSQGPQVVVADESAASGSKLDSYEARDPFDGIKQAGGVKPEDGSATAPIDSAGDKGTTDDLLGAGGSTGSTGSTGGGSTGDTGGGTGGGTTDPGTGTVPTDPPPVKKETAFYNFRLDLKFGKPGREKRMASMSRLSFLSVVGQPVALFLGVDETERKALFLVTPGLNHQGEGECIPKPTQCDFMSLAIGKEHYFSANDHEFRIELLDINRVKASAEKKEREIARKAAERRAERAGDGADGDPAPEPYEWPLLVDSAG